MTIDKICKELSITINEGQKKAIEKTEGFLQIIAGPGTGKTQTLILRTLNLLLRDENPIEPKHIALLTFTDKAGYELRERLFYSISKVKPEHKLKIHEMFIGTFHSLCHEMISKNLILLRSNNGKRFIDKSFTLLDEITQKFFIFERIDKILPVKNNLWLGKWDCNKSEAISKVIHYFGKIIEEMIDWRRFQLSNSSFLKLLATSFASYTNALVEENCVDFSTLQSYFLYLMRQKDVDCGFKYIMIDEYQDTNYIQQEIIKELSKKDGNLAVVGDDDQALYRFRGGTVRNIIEFKDTFNLKDNDTTTININYRSHSEIIKTYNDYINSLNWKKFRLQKNIQSIPDKDYKNYHSVIEFNSPRDIVDCIKKIIEVGLVDDYNQIAILLKSLISENAISIMNALLEEGINYYAPRAKKFFEQEPIKVMIGCLMEIFSYNVSKDAKSLSNIKPYYESIYRDYIDNSNFREKNKTLIEYINYLKNYFNSLRATSDITVLDVFYRLLSLDHFYNYTANEMVYPNELRNLAIFSKLIFTFQKYYNVNLIQSSEKVKYKLFNSFIYYLYFDGLNEYEDDLDIFPKGNVQIMTIHQSKGLEFPVVFVFTESRAMNNQKQIEEDLKDYYNRKEFEPINDIGTFDFYRLFYVAMSRPKQILGYYKTEKSHKGFNILSKYSVKYSQIDDEQLKIWEELYEETKRKDSLKNDYTVTGDIHPYNVCPRNYQYFRYYAFQPPESGQFLFGSLVHYTIEDIHADIINKRKSDDPEITQEFLESIKRRIDYYFEANKHNLEKRYRLKFNEIQFNRAKEQVLRYFDNNIEYMKGVDETEVELVDTREKYYLRGIVDLIYNLDGQLEMVDFKSQKKEDLEEHHLDKYKKQMAIYSYLLETKHNKKPDKLFLYFTGETNPDEARYEIVLKDRDIKKYLKEFDEIVDLIDKQDFRIRQKPETKTCRFCAMRFNCSKMKHTKSEYDVFDKKSEKEEKITIDKVEKNYNNTKSDNTKKKTDCEGQLNLFD